MVKPNQEARKKGIKLSKFRVAHHELHGNAMPAMQDKDILLKQEKHHKKLKERGNQ